MLRQGMKYVWGGRRRRETHCRGRLHPPRPSRQSVTLRRLLLCPAICLRPRSFSPKTSPSSSAEPLQPHPGAGEVLSEPSRRRHGRGDQRASCSRGLQRGLMRGFSAYFGCLSLPISDSARLPLSVHGTHEGYLAS